MRRSATLRLAALSLLIALVAVLIGGAARPPDELPAIGRQISPRFTFVDVYIDPKSQPLAAYQFELTARGADVTLAGVEGGEHAAYAQPPYYDPKANVQNRIIIASFNTGDDLPRRRTRVARIMLRVSGGNPIYSSHLQIAASSEAKPIAADISVAEGAAP